MEKYSRMEPNCVDDPIALLGITKESLRFGQTVEIEHEGVKCLAVVDFYIPAFFGPHRIAKAYQRFKNSKGKDTCNCQVILVWRDPVFGWREKRDIRPVTPEEFGLWINVQMGSIKVTPMPED